MLHRSLLPVITSYLSRRTRHVVNVYCSTLTNDSSPVQKERTNTVKMKGLIEKTELPKVKKKHKNKELKYIEDSLLYDKETADDIINYIQDVNPDVADFIRSMKWTLKKGVTSVLHLIDKDIAAKYVSLIKNDLSKNMCYVAEMNPGFGVLTRELLKVNVSKIHLYEANPKLDNVQKTICTKYPGKLNLISSNSNLFALTRLFYDDKMTTNEKWLDNFKAIERKNWEDETYMQVIGASDSRYLFTFILHSLLFRKGFMFYGRPTFYIAVLPTMWHNYSTDIISNHKFYSYSKVMFRLMFNYKFLGTLNRKAFIPWPKKKKRHANMRRNLNPLLEKENYEKLYVIKLEPKPDLYSEFSQKDWRIFSYFVKHHMQKRCTRVIPALETWIPDCGIRLIAKDYTIYTEFGDLMPVQILELFKEFQSWPEYTESYFIDSMNNSLGADNEIEFLNSEE